MTRLFVRPVIVALIAIAAGASTQGRGADNHRALSVDHYVRVKSTVPAIAGQPAHIYVRERMLPGTVVRSAGLADRVVLFVHGAGTPAEVAFDVPYQDYSWMEYLANAGFDTFAMDTTGYGRSSRPAPMDDPCNLAPNQQASFVPSLFERPCTPSYPHELTTIASDWDDIGAVVDYIRALRHVERVSLVGWSLGGPRAGGYTGQHPEKVQKLVLLAPAYNRDSAAAAPKIPRDGVPMNTQSRDEFIANWERQVGCADQVDLQVRDAVWSQMLESDPVGATWGTGVRRAPQTTTWGWNLAMISKTQTPTLIFAGVHDKQVGPERVKLLYEDLGATQKVFVDLGCSSHNAMWEKNHLVMFRASLEWLVKGTVNNSPQGIVRLGY
jgi:pimeloyl-ACP methyl ester carboxylesterase